MLSSSMLLVATIDLLGSNAQGLNSWARSHGLGIED